MVTFRAKVYPGIDPNSNPFDPDIPGDVILGKKVPVDSRIRSCTN